MLHVSGLQAHVQEDIKYYCINLRSMGFMMWSDIYTPVIKCKSEGN